MNRSLKNQELVIHIDGASRGNPGPASVGVEIRTADDEVIGTFSETLGTATNNVAEYMALVVALEEAAVLKPKRVRVYTDSELLAKQFNGEYKIKDPVIRLLALCAKRLLVHLKDCRVFHVRREENREADRLANEALDRQGRELF